MTSRLEELELRKRALVAQCAREREQLARAERRVRLPFGVGATLWSVIRLIKSHPAVVAGLSGLLLTGRAKNLTHSVTRLINVWQAAYPLWFRLVKRRTGK